MSKDPTNAQRQAAARKRLAAEGGRRLLQERTGVPPEAAARGRAKAASPESQAKMMTSKRGVPAHPNTAKALLDAARKPKPDGWGQRASQWMLAGQAKKRSQYKD